MAEHPLKQHIDNDIRTRAASKLLASKSSVPDDHFNAYMQRVAEELQLESPKDVSKIVQQFRFGAQTPVAKNIWEKMIAFANELSHDAQGKHLANFLNIDASAVSRGIKNGALSTETLIVALTSLDWSFARLDDMPSKKDRAVHGHIYAIMAAKRLLSKTEVPKLTVEAYVSLAVLNQDSTFKCKSFKTLTSTEWKDVLARVRPKIAAELALEEDCRLSLHTKSEFLGLCRRWQSAYSLAKLAVPYEWDPLSTVVSEPTNGVA